MNRESRLVWYRRVHRTMARMPGLSVGAKVLWFCIESHSNIDGGGAFPSIARLMRYTGKGKKWVEKHLKELEAHPQQLMRHRHRTTEKGRVNDYQVGYPNTVDTKNGGYLCNEGLGPKTTQPIGSKNDPIPEEQITGTSYSPPRCSEEPTIYALPDPAEPKRAQG